MDSDDVKDCFADLARQFRDLANAVIPDGSQQLDTLSELAAKALKRCVGERKCDWLFDVPWPETRHDLPFESETSRWAGIWLVIVIALEKSNSDRLPSNAACFTTTKCMNPTIGAEVIRTGVVKKSAWQIRAFRYALVCEWIAEQLHSANSERAERTATKSAGNDELSERVKTLEIAARGNKPKSKRDRIRTQRLKFCVSRRKRGDTWEQICRDYLEAIRSRKTYIEDKKAHPDTLRQMCEQYHPELKR